MIKIYESIKNRVFIPILKTTDFGLGILYGLLSNEFFLEYRAVLEGKLNYFHSNDKHYLLRRNIHRIEKGIIMKPRKEWFAEDYIFQTVEAFQTTYSRTDKNDRLIKWSHDVLENYFEIVIHNTKITKAFNLFKSIEYTESEDDISKFRPYNVTEQCNISYSDFLNLSIKRRSVRWYEDKIVPTELIKKALKIALLSPSACNRQPFKYYIFNDPELAKKIGAIPMGAKGLSHNYPAVAVVVGQLNAYFSERDRHVIYIDGSLSAMSFIYALETLGLSSCIINWPDDISAEKKLRKILNLKPYERPILFISFGYPDLDSLVPYSCKKTISETTIFNLNEE